MKVYAATDKGIGKAENEDRIIVAPSIISSGDFQMDTDCSVIAIADGVGGNNAGTVAAHFVANEICTLKAISAEILSAVNDRLISISRGNPAYSSMATTLSGFCIVGNEMQLFSIGNTRVYALQGGKYLKQLTTDDTTLQYLLETGRLGAEEAKSFDKRNEITACFGGNDPSLFKLSFSTREKLSVPFVITSDGAHDYVSVDCLEDIIGSSGISLESCKSIILSARKNGSQDDISVVLGEL